MSHIDQIWEKKKKLKRINGKKLQAQPQFIKFGHIHI
jgi:hypothetical protein